MNTPGTTHRKTKASAFQVLIIEDADQHVFSKGWAEMIRKVHEVDSLSAPNVLARGKSSLSYLIILRHFYRHINYYINILVGDRKKKNSNRLEYSVEFRSEYAVFAVSTALFAVSTAVISR